MQPEEKLVVVVERTLKRKFFDTVHKRGTNASFIVRKFLTDYIKKGTSDGGTKRGTTKTLNVAGTKTRQ
jgi:hypothetical protein